MVGAVGLEWGLFDAATSPGGGWQLTTAQHMEQQKVAFMASYNALGGVRPIKTFKSGNCCIGVAGAAGGIEMLEIQGSRYGYLFPASTTGGIACNPISGYVPTESVAFYRVAPQPFIRILETCVHLKPSDSLLHYKF